MDFMGMLMAAARAAADGVVAGQRGGHAGALPLARSAAGAMDDAWRAISGRPVIPGMAEPAGRQLRSIGLSTTQMGAWAIPGDALQAVLTGITDSRNRILATVSGAASQIPGLSHLASQLPGIGSLDSVFSVSKVPAQSWQLQVSTDSEAFYFALGAAAFDELRRRSQYVLSAQDRLTRAAAVQGVSVGGETLSVSGAIWLAPHGAGHLDTLRRYGETLRPVTLTTGYGEQLGRWQIASIDDTQGSLFRDGAPRKQTYSIEFTRYGEDYQDV